MHFKSKTGYYSLGMNRHYQLFIFISGENASHRTSTDMSLDEWKPKLQYFMYKSFADLRYKII